MLANGEERDAAALAKVEIYFHGRWSRRRYVRHPTRMYFTVILCGPLLSTTKQQQLKHLKRATETPILFQSNTGCFT
jgi:hypothetical protein